MKILNRVLIRVRPCGAFLSDVPKAVSGRFLFLEPRDCVHGPARRTGAGLEIEG